MIEKTIGYNFKKSVSLLKNNLDIKSPELDILILFEYILKIPKNKIFVQFENTLSEKNIYLLKKYVLMRYLNYPIAYIINIKDFYGRSFFVDNSVLIPRPESEFLVEITKYIVNKLQDLPLDDFKYSFLDVDLGILNKSLESLNNTFYKSKNINILDIGTGSGNIGTTLALELPKVHVDLVDISPKALKIAKMNVKKFTTEIGVIKSNLLSNVHSNYHIFVANLPYIPLSLQIDKSIYHEPFSALFSDQDGVYFYNKLVKDINKLKDKPLYLIIEKIPACDLTLAKIVSNFNLKPLFLSQFVNVYGF